MKRFMSSKYSREPTWMPTIFALRRVSGKRFGPEDAYLRNGTVGCDALHGSFIGVLAAKLQNVCSAFSLGNFLDRQVPVLRIVIIDEIGRAKLTSSFKFVVGR